MPGYSDRGKGFHAEPFSLLKLEQYAALNFFENDLKESIWPATNRFHG
jgi:hypothetical protein